MTVLKTYRFLIARRFVQVTILALFIIGNYWGISLLKGNLSSALLFETIPLADPLAVLQIFVCGGLASFELIVGAIIVLVIYGVFAGRMFCSWICPVNIISDSASFMHKKVGFKSKIKFSPKSRYGVLILTIILSFILGYAAFEAISPIGMLHRSIIFGFGSGLVIVAALFLFELAVVKFGWCGHLCPLGAFYAIIGKYSLLKIGYSHSKCTSCMQCFSVCPEKEVLHIVTKKSGIILSSECTNCMRCVEACSDNALVLTHRYKKIE